MHKRGNVSTSMRVVQLHYRRVLTTLALGALCTLYLVGRATYHAQLNVEQNAPWRSAHEERDAPSYQSTNKESDSLNLRKFMPRWLQNQIAPMQTDAVKTSRRGYEIVGSESYDEFLEESIPENKTFESQKILCSYDNTFNQGHLGACPDYNCKMEGGPKCLSTADAVIFQMGIRSSSSQGAWSDRRPEQYYVYMSQESPMHSASSAPYPGFYNLTMGYRRDADIPCPYGYVVKDPNGQKRPSPAEWAQLLKTKIKPFAWFVSNCNAPSKRSEYVKKLQQFLPVDIFGGCGPFSCPKPTSNCIAKLNEEYRFYLALENSVCTDYITEKLWEQKRARKNKLQGLHAYLVPIVISREIVEKYLPPNSFLALDDYKTIQDFVADIQSYMNDDEKYTKLALEWRKAYRTVFLNGNNHDINERPWGFCRLCKLVQSPQRPHKVIENLQQTWGVAAACKHGQLLSDIIKNSS